MGTWMHMHGTKFENKKKTKKKPVLPRYHHVVCIEKKKKTKTFKLKTSIAESASISV